MIFAKALNQTFADLLSTDPRVLLLGEDLVDPYGGAFKVTAGLSTRFPDRVRATPISEAAIIGIAGGLALEGYRPIVEIMFGDFLTLGADQILNAISKYQEMYAQQVTAPVIIRTPSGGGRGYGATHSQSLEKHFLGIPNLLVVAASPWHVPRETFASLLAQEQPALYVEHKLLYGCELALPRAGKLGPWLAAVDTAPGFLPTLCFSLRPRDQCTVTLLAYGYQALQAQGVIEKLAYDGVYVELIVPSQICPMNWSPLLDSVAMTGALVTVEEGTAGWCWGTEAAAKVQDVLFARLRQPTRIVTSAAATIPAARHLERAHLVNNHQLKRTLLEAQKP